MEDQAWQTVKNCGALPTKLGTYGVATEAWVVDHKENEIEWFNPP